LLWDDTEVTAGASASPLLAVSRGFWQGATRFLGHDPYYRPAVNLTYALEKLGTGPRAWRFHAGNIGLHALAAALFCLLVWELTRSRWTALIAGLAFGTHPLLADSVAYVAGRADILCSVGLLIALLGLVRHQERPDARAITLAVAGFALAVASKETGAAFIIVAPLWLWAARTGRAFRPRDWLLAACLVAVLALYAAARLAVLHQLLPALPSVGFTDRLAFGLQSANEFGRLLGMFLLPVSGRIFLWPDAPARFGLPLLLTAAYLALPLLIRRRGLPAPAGLAWLWAAAFLLPFAAVDRFGPLGRMLYIPAAGLLLLLVLACRTLVRRRPGSARPLAVLALGVCLAFAPLAVARARVWQDPFALFTRLTTEAPANPAGWFNLAFEHRNRHRPDAALAAYRRVIELDSSIALAYSNAAALLQARGAYVEAADLYRKTIELQPDYPLAHNNLGIILYKLGDPTGAVRELRRCLELKPDDAGAAFNLSRVYDRLGERDSAAALLDRAYRLKPADPLIRQAWQQQQRNPTP
jgi:tetratricopeptide (TPR) repeat protein